ncbi:hypothetical protein HYI12_14815 [Acinetobacter sp. SwsAc3]|nr:hypothetical protein [Acinetobacter sp. SwsAc3]
MRYFKKDLEVYAFEENQLHLVDNTFSAMNAEEVDRHMNPQNYMSDEEKELFRLTQFKPLTRRQFKLALLENGLLDTVEQMIESIEDPITKTRIQIEYSESERFERTNGSIQYMLGLLELTTDQVDEMWRYAITL